MKSSIRLSLATFETLLTTLARSDESWVKLHAIRTRILRADTRSQQPRLEVEADFTATHPKLDFWPVNKAVNGRHKLHLLIEHADSEHIRLRLLPDTFLLSVASLLLKVFHSPVSWSFGEASKDLTCVTLRLRDIRIPQSSGEGTVSLPEALRIHALSLHPDDDTHPVQFHFSITSPSV